MRKPGGENNEIISLADILFRPLLECGRPLLNYRIQRLKSDINEWAEQRSVGPEIDEASDVKYLRSLDPVEWKVSCEIKFSF